MKYLKLFVALALVLFAAPVQAQTYRGLATTQVTVTTASTAVASERSQRGYVTVTNITGTQPLYCGTGTATVAASQYIPAAVGASFTWPYTGAISCITVVASQSVSVSETY